MKKLIHDQDGIYMIDEECLKKKEKKEREKEMRWQSNNIQDNRKKRKKSF